MWTEKKHSSCHRAKFHEIELFPFISRFFKKKTLQIQKGIQVQFHDFLMIFFSIQLQTLFLSKNTKTDIITKTKKDIRDKKYFSTLKQLESTVMRCFFIILSIVWLRKQLFFMFKQMHKLLTYNTIIFSFIFWLFSLTLCCIPFYIR